ncbi:glycoside hydrolase/deacetylase [Lophiostoma macrostomum CBS 122681]|uniref:chitin deacetylase n=1 Tax=Lophiostoma macrostomum CBS 122681 TaxID=1314788 RepID=A0A6A6SU85_9PLEO|nr:glycoside hydrolase/deacetylase [Lophiostoma macrostomum CBS 122681]
MSTTQAEWPNGTRTAIVLTIDNMGEAADLDRGLWPEHEPVGKHFSVVEVLPKFLAILKKYDVKATYFIESWNLSIYRDAIAKKIAGAGHEIGWHAWRHEAWSKLKDADAEKANFARSFGSNDGITIMYKGFRPPGGIIHGERTLKLCVDYGLQYISPAGFDASIVELDDGTRSIILLPFRWTTVDAYFYMETFAKLRTIKGELPEEPQPPEVLKQGFITQVDRAITDGGYLSLLFHPFLNAQHERLQVFEEIVRYLAEKRDRGDIWLARCCDVTEWINAHPSLVPSGSPVLDEITWR